MSAPKIIIYEDKPEYRKAVETLARDSGAHCAVSPGSAISLASLMQPKSTTHVPVTFSELYGPVSCALCGGDAWAIWVTPEEKETHSFEHLFRYHGTARCAKCGPPNIELSNSDPTKTS